MICIYSQNNTDYTKNGDAVLIPTSCYVSMTINGAWSLTLEHPYDPEERYKYIVEGAVIRVDLKCINELTSVQQRFRIYQYTKNMHSVSCIAFPIAMESTYDSPIDNLVITGKTGVEAMALLQAYTEKYTLSTDITTQKSTSFANTNINSAIASGDDNCFISVWGGEILYDNLNYSIKSSLGNSNSGAQIRYGRNLSAIKRQTDDSGLTTRIKPISKDGIRLNGTGYVDSPKISDYPIIHTRYMTAPYNLIEDDVSSNSATAVATRSAQSAVSSAVSSTSGTSYSAAIGAGYQPEYIKSIKDDIISAVQTMALSNVISTSLYNYLSKTIADGLAWMASLEQPAWDWMGSYESGWRYGNEDGYAVSQFIRIGKKWSYFGENGYWQEPADDEDDWDWYQVAGEEGKKYGNFKKYYAHNTYVYITMDETLTKYWFDSDGWYDSEKTDESDWSWHGSGTAADPYWFGDPDAEGDEKKYAHSTWLFIDGTYYFFDEFGYYDGSTKFDDYQWDWVESGENFWFGNAEDDTFGAVYVTSQWLKINGSWYYFDSNGYVVSENSSKSAAISIFTTGMASVQTTVDTQASALYTVLYNLMTAYANKQYSEGVDVPAITITVNMVDLSKTTEYEGYSALETVKLGDSVAVKDDEHNISLSSRVIGLTYDCIRDYNSEVVIGQPASSVSEILGNAGGTPVAGGFDTSAIESQIEALQDKVGDIFLNDASIVTDGVGRFGIQAGSNISISRSGNILTINGEGGALEYFVETQNTLYGHDDSIKYLKNDNVYKFDAPAIMRNYAQPDDATHKYYKHIAPNIDSNDIVGIHGGIITPLYNTRADGICIISKNASHCTFTVEYYNSQYPADETTPTGTFTYSYDGANKNVAVNVSVGWYGKATCDSFTYNNETYYIVADGNSWDWWTKRTNIEEILGTAKPLKMYEENYTIHNEQDTSTFSTLGAYGLAVVKAYNQRNEYNGIAKNNGLAFFAGGSDANGTNAPIKIYDDGTADGLATDDDLLKKQDKLIAGQNVQIASDGKTISATDTTYNDFAGSTHGLVPPVQAQAGKYLKDDGTWDDASSVEANPSGTATDTLTKLEVDGTIYDIQGGGGGGSNLIVDAQIYSTDEKQVGVWTDGKPLYQKTFSTSINISANGYKTITISDYISNVALIINSEAFVLSNNVTTFLPYILSNNTLASYSMGYAVGGNDIYISRGNASGFSGDVYITLLYTKTTDTAGSGGYQAYGFSPVIYSEEEREVGVWTDDKPLYQKTYHNISLSNNADNVIDSSFGTDKVLITQKIDYTGLSNQKCEHNASIQDTLYINNGQLIYYISKSGAWWANLNSADVTVWYTKTTDTAGSGEYNTLGIPNEHYDATERVIGTWFGDTLYEITLDLGSERVFSSGWTAVIAHQNTYNLIFDGKLVSESKLGYNVDLASNDTTYLELYTNHSIQGRYLTFKYTKTS